MEQFKEIPQNCLKNLEDKKQEKKLAGAQELQKLVLDKVIQNNIQFVREIIDHLGKKYLTSSSFQLRKGGLLAFSAIAISVSTNSAMSLQLIDNLVNPVLQLLKDSDQKVKCASCHCMYNIIKSMKEISLKYVEEIFKQLIYLLGTDDNELKASADQLNSELKDIINYAATNNSIIFDIDRFMKLFTEKLKGKNNIVRKSLICWLDYIDQIPNINISKYLPSMLQELFNILSDQNLDISNCINNQIVNNYQPCQEIDSEIIENLLKILNDQIFNLTAKEIALKWIEKYIIKLIEKNYLYSDQISIQNQNSYIIQDLNQLDKPQQILTQILISKIPQILKQVLQIIHKEKDLSETAKQVNSNIIKLIKNNSNQFEKEIQFLLPIIQENLDDQNYNSAESSLEWIRSLQSIYKDKIKISENIVYMLIKKLADGEESQISEITDILSKLYTNNDSFENVILKILQVFFDNNELFWKNQQKITLIIKNLCNHIDPRKVYLQFALQIKKFKQSYNFNFKSKMVEILDILLLTDKDLNQLRDELKTIKYKKKEENKQNVILFESLYSTWTFNPISTLTLCFFCQQYELAYNIIYAFSEVEIQVEFLVQIAKLINQLESPIFVNLRLQLLESEKYPYLLRCMYGLMMLLPQGKAFNVIKQRLKNIQILQNNKETVTNFQETKYQIDLEKFINIYKETRSQNYNQ